MTYITVSCVKSPRAEEAISLVLLFSQVYSQLLCTFWNVEICEEIALRDSHNGVLREISSCRGGTFMCANLFATLYSQHFIFFA